MRVKCEFGPYTLVRRHAVGGMSHVFIARDETLDREVAVKILSEKFSTDKRRVKAFREEAKVTASFSHPNVVRVLTTGQAFGRLYIAMEYVAGGHLEKHIKARGGIPEIEMLPIAIDIAQGLKAASATGRIHRDVKPGNILLDAGGQAKIVDFGLALETHGGKAHAAEIWATPYYVSPETIQGNAEDVRSDIYAFGATLYHALMGKVPCGDRTMSSSALVEAKKKVVPLSIAMPSLSAESCKIVEKAMAFEPKDRFSSYDEIIFLLEKSLLRLRSEVAGAVETSGAVAKQMTRKRNHVLGTLSLSGLFLLAASGGAYWWIHREPKSEDQKKLSVIQAIPFVSAAESTPSLAKDYREARNMLKARDYGNAVAAFSKMGAASSVPEPTRSWARVEAVVAGYLAGQASVATGQAMLASAHISALPENPALPDKSLVAMLDKTIQSHSIAVDWLDVSNSNASSMMAWMLAGLKNWEQGALVEGVGYFSAVTGAKVPEDAVWLGLYQQIANDYLADYKLLSNPNFNRLPPDEAKCREVLEELDAILVSLKTQGRARSDVQALQVDFTKYAKDLAAP
jgi:eukaryotic-like serine/threonine-protein kinase